jgi:hypothetical protein
MRRATVTIRDELEEALESYRGSQEFPPSLAVLVNAALSEYLARRGYSSDEEAAGSPTVYEDAPRLRGGPDKKTAAEMVIEDRG